MRKFVLIALLSIVLLPSCMDEPPTYPNTNDGNFEALWSIIDTRYCYLDYKKINWDSIHTVYKQRVPNAKDEVAFFDLMGKMLGELKDGHVNLYSDFDLSRYWKWYTDFAPNFNESIIFSPRYLGSDYRFAGGFRYGKIGSGNIGYMYLSSFSDGFSDTNMSYIFKSFGNCNGLIIDVRNNGGGSLDLAKQLASYFIEKDVVTGYICHKTGNGHSDFSKPVEIKVIANTTVQWQRPVIVLTNRMSYSATNDFVNCMKKAPNAIIVGDKTGGGGGLPLSSEIPNGWLVRFSSSPMFDSNMQHTEWGIEPTIKDSITKADEAKGIDSIIERAIKLIGQQ